MHVTGIPDRSYMQAVDGGDAGSSGFNPGLWHSLTSHLSPTHCSFFAHWMGLVEAEESRGRGARKRMWAQAAEAREADGECLGSLQLLVSAL